MKISAKPISSPSRTDKFPTPLMMRFLRSNVGSRSRGSRSRSSSPMFIMRTKKNVAVINNNDVQQEPSSPKVTCIGQVRARRSSSKSKAKNSKSKPPNPNSTTNQPKRVLLPHRHRHHCCCCCSCVVRTDHFCCNFRKPKLFCSYFRKWVMFFRCGYCKKVDTRDDCSSRVESITRRVQNDVNLGTRNVNVSDVEDKEGQKVGETKEGFLESSSPPKNALLLTRCRSAPYRSSSLAGRFWGSPLRTPEAESNKSPKKEVQEPPEGETERPAVESRNSSSHEGSATEEFESSSNNGGGGGGGGGGGAVVHPLLLTRCKSEPARTGERLNPEVNFWRQRRSDTTESCLQESSKL